MVDSCVLGRDTLGAEIAKALGLKYDVVDLDISIHLNEVTQITVTYYPEANDVQNIVPVLTRATFKLLPT